KYMLKRVQTNRTKPPLKILVFNNHTQKQRITLKKEEGRYTRFLCEDVIFTDNSFQDFSVNPLRFIKNI
ncbi:hypothetical protein V3P86_10955, partial [Clostridioides difficile]